MATHVIPTVDDARAAANAWLIDHLPDRFSAGIPTYDPLQEGWRIPVWLAYPGLGPLGRWANCMWMRSAARYKPIPPWPR